MKGTEEFKRVIKKMLVIKCLKDEVFKEKCTNPKKNLDDCITYILNTVKKSGNNGFADDEIYGMAIHYYDEENIDIGGSIRATVKVNHQIELTEEEIAKAKQDAKDAVFKEQRDKMTKKKVNKPNTVIENLVKSQDEPLSLF